LKQTTPLASNQKISIGETPSSFIEAEIHDCRLSLKGYEIEAILYIDNYSIPLGLFTVQEPTEANGSGTQKIIAYDRMSNTSNFTYEAKGHTNAGDIFAEICSQCGYSAEIGDLTAVSVSDGILNGYDCRTALSYLASFLGKNCVVGADGIFKMVEYHIVDNEIDINSLDTLEFPSSGSSVDYIFCTIDENTTLDSGIGKSGINIVNPLISTTEQLQTILADIQTGIGTNYYPATFKQLNGDPRIEVGDTILVQQRNILTGDVEADYVPVMSLVREFDGGLTVTIQAYEPESEFHISTLDQIKLIEAAIKKSKTRTETVAELNDLMATALGLYRTEIKGASGDVKYYYHNKDTLKDSTYIFTMNANGFAFVTGENCWNDGNPNWQNGITSEGNAVLNTLSLYFLSANLIKTGRIESDDEKTYFDLDEGVFRSESDVEENRKLVMEQTVGKQTFEIQDGAGNTVAKGNFSAKGLTIEQNDIVTDKDYDAYIAEKKAEWEKAHAPTTWEEYASGITSLAASMLIAQWKLEYMVNNALLSIVLKSTVEGYEGEIIITPQGITIDGSPVLTNKVTPDELGITPAAIGAAPSGFGLGETNGKSCEDCNTALKIGFYILRGTNTLNAPAHGGLDYAPMIVQRRWGTVIQTVTNDITSARRYSLDDGETWSEWEYINPPMVAGTEYRTTERYQKNPVYVKLINFGTMPNTTAKSVSLGTNLNVVSIEGKTTKGNYMIPLSNHNGINSVYYNKSDGKLYVETKNDASEWSAEIVVKYTK
jgi:hypothetical protein